MDREGSGELLWGRRYLMVRPDRFRLAYAINPYMRLDEQPDPLELMPEPLVLTESEALTFAANSVVIGRRVFMPACPPRVRSVLDALGFEVVLVDVPEFHKGGGSIRCLTNPLDIEIGRDVPSRGTSVGSRGISVGS
jgi:N-dimethylarginine dimethylaminohydrolase